MHVLGIDAGGTKTVCLLADERGKILAEGRGPGANLHSAGELEVEKVLHEVMEDAIGDRDITPAAICLGIAGVDRDDEARTVRAIMRRIGHKSRVLVVNDALIALVAGAKDAPGIVIIAGTGSIVYGRNAGGQAARAGGWGHMIGDEGSGYWIGREAVAAVMRAADGRGPATRLSDDILAHFSVNDVSRLPRIVYDREIPRMRVAALGPIVEGAASEGDAVAMRILERAVDELMLVVPSLAAVLPRRLVEVAPRCQVQLLDEEPAVGAVWLALAEAREGAQIPHY